MPLKLWLFLLTSLFLMAACDGNHPRLQGYVEGENLFLASPFYGILQELPVHRGEQVKKGQRLFTLDPNPQALTLLEAQGELDKACNTLIDLQKPQRLPEIEAIEAQIEQTDAQIKLALLRVNRYQELFKRNATEKDSLDAAMAQLEQQQQLKRQYQSNLALSHLGARTYQIKAQQAQVNALLAKVKQAQWNLAQKTIFAPDSGVIFDTYYRLGEFVPTQQPVMSLLTPNNIRIEFFAPLQLLSKINLKQTIDFDCEGCKSPNKAIIEYISPQAEYLPPLVYSRQNDAYLVFRIKARILSQGPFKPGQPVSVRL